MKIITITLCLLICLSAVASSCRDTTDRIIADCQYGQCSEVFFVTEVKTSNACHRRPTVSDPPFWAKEVIEKELVNSDLPEGPGVFELLIRYDWWCPVDVVNADDFFIHKNSDYNRNRIYTELKHIPEATFINLLFEWQDKEVQGKKEEEQLSNSGTWVEFVMAFCLLSIAVVLLVHGIKNRKFVVLTFTGAGMFLMFLVLLINMGLHDLDWVLILLPGLLLLNAFAVLDLIYERYKFSNP